MCKLNGVVSETEADKILMKYRREKRRLEQNKKRNTGIFSGFKSSEVNLLKSNT